MEGITRPSMTRLARKAGVKSVSDDCFNVIRQLIENRLDEIIDVAVIVNSEHPTKTMMTSDVYDSLGLIGNNIAQSNDLGTTTCNK